MESAAAKLERGRETVGGGWGRRIEPRPLNLIHCFVFGDGEGAKERVVEGELVVLERCTRACLRGQAHRLVPGLCACVLG